VTAAAAKRLNMETLLLVLGQQIRVNVREGTGVPRVLCNGNGASLEVLDPLVEDTVGYARELLGGNGILLEHNVGRVITGLSAFV
jgi:hypothetical protein